jgi:capsular exopolysaccharide synthesis family protein
LTDHIDPLARFLPPLRRWWPLIAAVVVIGVVLAWVTRPDPPVALPGTTEIVEPGVAYRATHILVRGQITSATENFQLVGMLAQQGVIKARTAEELGDRVEVGAVDEVQIESDLETGTLSIHATQPTETRATLLASTYAQQVVRYFDEQVVADREQRIELATERLAVIDERIQTLLSEQGDLEEDSLPARLNESELNVLVDQYGMLQGELRNLATSDVDGSATFETLQEPVPFEVAVGGGNAIFEMPSSAVPRLVFALLASLLVGGALALGIDRVDTRVRTRADAQEATGLPVIAEVPRDPRGARGSNALAIAEDPGSEVAEAYRSLRLSVEYEPRWRLDRAAPTGDDTVATATRVTGEGAPRTLLVSSAATGEGKSTVAANLAASLSEHGRRVLVVDCDFRRTTVATMLSAQESPGLRELGSLSPGSLSSLARTTALPHVALVPSGRPGMAPVWFLESSAELVEQARSLADVVIFDTGPLRVTNEAAALIPWVDSVLLVTRCRRTRRSEARLAIEQLARLRATVAGVVFLGGQRTSRTSTYYRSLRRVVSHEAADA